MKIILDTNIWYYLGVDEILFAKFKNLPVAPTSLNLSEIQKSDNIINNVDLVKNALIKIFYFKNNIIFENPFIYLAQLNSSPYYDNRQLLPLLKVLVKISKGYRFKDEQKIKIKQTIDLIRSDFKLLARLFNEKAEELRLKNKHSKAWKEEDTLHITINLINYIVEVVTNNEKNLFGFDFSQIELFVKTLDLFFNEIETTGMTIKDNDWNDLAILAYVQPNDKYYTNDKRWVKLIKAAGMEHYLFSFE